MVDIGVLTNRETVAIVSDMNQPLGFAIGNALEVEEAINTLKGAGPKDLEELCLVLGSQMLILGQKAANFTEAYQILKEIINSGKALETLKQFVTAQGGNSEIVDNPKLLPQAETTIDIVAPDDGYVNRINAEEIGVSAMLLGAGRETKESKIDLAVGIKLRKKEKDFVNKGGTIATLYVNNKRNLEEVKKRVQNAYTIAKFQSEGTPLIYGIVTKDGIGTVDLPCG